VESALAAFRTGLVFEVAGLLEPGLAAAGAAQGVVLGIAVRLAATVKAEVVRFMAHAGFDEGVQLRLRAGGTMVLDLKTLLPGIGLAGMEKVVPLAVRAAQVGPTIAPTFDMEAAVGAGEFRERGHRPAYSMTGPTALQSRNDEHDDNDGRKKHSMERKNGLGKSSSRQ